MNSLFDPKSVAVIGASDNPSKLGFHVMKSLVKGGYEGSLVPVNPGAERIFGIKAFASVSVSQVPIDLAIVVVPASLVAGVLKECAAARVKGIVLITAGFKEIDDPAGAVLHEEIAEIANQAKIPVIGPNTFGMVNLRAKLNASFTPEFSMANPGDIALVSQSGGISHLLGFLAMGDGVGFSKIVGLGNRLNVDFAQMADYLMDDPDTRAIALYVEGIDDPGELLAAAKRHAGKKPIVAFKSGSGSVGDAAARSHTGTMAGRHEIYSHAFKQAGILTVPRTQALLDAAKALAACSLPGGPGVAVLSGQAGPSMAACDVCEQRGLEIVRFGTDTQARINELLPPLALRTNPVDMGPAWYDAAAIKEIIRAVMDDKKVHGILFLMMFASANVDALTGISGLLREWGQKKPVVSCILSPPGIWDDQIQELEDAKALVNYATPERAACAMAYLWEHKLLQRIM
ncbi:CoA binding domain protein [delta proteobacterium NaphS2]|nr:CoA binding domain protein [delta proteobacterium NaphS2]